MRRRNVAYTSEERLKDTQFLLTHFGENSIGRVLEEVAVSLNSTFCGKRKNGKKNRFYFDETDLSLHSIATKSHPLIFMDSKGNLSLSSSIQMDQL